MSHTLLKTVLSTEHHVVVWQHNWLISILESFLKKLACHLNLIYNVTRMLVQWGSQGLDTFDKWGAIMASKTDTEVIIGGKVFTLSGYESEEYLQKVASYINNKCNEYSKVDSFRRQPLEKQSVLLQLNIADDYFKAKKKIDVLEEELQTKEKELYDLKHELISAQIKLENSEKNAKELQANLTESANKIIRLEAELKDK